MSPAKHNLQILVSMQQLTEIRLMAKEKDCSMGAYLRFLHQNAHQHSQLDTPTCPNGQRCFVPQMHPRTDNQQHRIPIPSED